MCRLVAYVGHDILLEDVLVKPVNSIIMQSLHARESSIPTNGDGFGLGWYVPSISSEPALFTSISPAWNDRNLLNLTAKIKSPVFFAHVRAASAGGVTVYNCHPFVSGDWMLMHNGGIGDFIQVKRHLRRLLDDDMYNWIQGDTDSEHLFALFLQCSKGKDLSNIEAVADVLEETFNLILLLVQQINSTMPSYFNVCLTDGKRLVASRYCSDPKISPETMHYSVGDAFIQGGQHECMLVTSEKLTNIDAQWHVVPENHILMVAEDLKAFLRPIG